MCFVFFLLSMHRGLSATYPAPLSTVFEIKDVNRFLHVYTSENFPYFSTGGFPHPEKQLKIWYSRARSLCAQCSSNSTILGDGNHSAVVDIPRMYVLYVTFGGDVRFWRYKPTKNLNFWHGSRRVRTSKSRQLSNCICVR